MQPYRFKGNVYYCSKANIKRRRHVKALMDDQEINLAGVGMIIRMAEMHHQIQEKELEIEQLRQTELSEEISKGG